MRVTCRATAFTILGTSASSMVVVAAVPTSIAMDSCPAFAASTASSDRAHATCDE